MVTSKPRSQSEKDLIRVKAWTSSQKHPENAKSHHSETAKIVLFVQVLRGDSPIIGAKAMAAIKLESMTNNGTTVEYLPSVNLQDNGYGGTSKIQYCKVASSRPVYYSILELFGQRSHYISITFLLHKPSDNH